MIAFERLDIPANAIWDRSSYPDEGGLFLISDGNVYCVVNVQKGDRGSLFSCPLPADIELNEWKEKERIDISERMEKQFKKLEDKIVSNEKATPVVFNGISEGGLIELVKIIKK